MSNKKTDNAIRNLFIEKIYNICDGKKAEEVFLTYIKSDGTEEELDSLVKKSDISGIVCDEEIYQKYAYKWTQKYPVFNIKTGDLFLDREYFSESSKDSDDVLAILYSSGTTSEPKGVMITYEAQMKSAELLLRAFGTNDIRYLLVFPMFHVSGFSVFLLCFWAEDRLDCSKIQTQ